MYNAIKLIVLLIVFLLIITIYYFVNSAQSTIWYGYEIQFVSAPQDDTKLELWLKAQDGVSFVVIERTDRKSIDITFEYTGNSFRRPRASSILEACKSMGYTDLVIIDSEVSPGR